MKKLLIILTLVMLATTLIGCNEAETASITNEDTETIITENVIIEKTLT